MLGAGDACLISCAERSVFVRPRGNALGLRLPFAAMAQRVPHIENMVAQCIPAGNEALNLLRDYAGFSKAARRWNPPSWPRPRSRTYTTWPPWRSAFAATPPSRPGIAGWPRRRLHSMKLHILDNLERPRPDDRRDRGPLPPDIAPCAAAFRARRHDVLGIRARRTAGAGERDAARTRARGIARSPTSRTKTGLARSPISTRTFRRHFGVSPSEVRGRQR